MFHARKLSCSLFALLILTVSAPGALADDAAESTPPVKTKLKIAKTDTAIYVGDLHCKSCARKIARKLYAVKSVVKVRSDVKADVVVITPQRRKQLDVKKLWAAAQKAGFQPLKLVGPTGAFEPDAKTKAPVLVPEQVAGNPQ